MFKTTNSCLTFQRLALGQARVLVLGQNAGLVAPDDAFQKASVNLERAFRQLSN